MRLSDKKRKEKRFHLIIPSFFSFLLFFFHSHVRSFGPFLCSLSLLSFRDTSKAIRNLLFDCAYQIRMRLWFILFPETKIRILLNAHHGYILNFATCDFLRYVWSEKLNSNLNFKCSPIHYFKTNLKTCFRRENKDFYLICIYTINNKTNKQNVVCLDATFYEELFPQNIDNDWRCGGATGWSSVLIFCWSWERNSRLNLFSVSIYDKCY